MRIITLLIVLLLAALMCAAAVPKASSFLHNGVTAPRGNSGEFPENTMVSYKSGIEVGADWIELDIFRTKDGKLVVIHDNTTERTGDKTLSVPDSTYEELLTVDVATDFRKRMGKTIDECPVERIPLLENVLRVVMKQNRTRVSIQPKMDCVAEATVGPFPELCPVDETWITKNSESVQNSLPDFW